MGKQKIVTVKKNTGKGDEPRTMSAVDRRRYLELLGEKTLELDHAKATAKGIQDEIDKIKTSLETNNYDEANQIPMFGEDGAGKPDAMAAARAQAAKNGKATNGAAEHA